MSIYSERLATLKKDIKAIQSKKKKKFKKEQKIMIDFINGVTTHAHFPLANYDIYLHRGDEKKGFQHILEKHFCKGCPGSLTAMEILNMTDIVKQGIMLTNQGVSNKKLIVYTKIKGLNQYKLVLKPEKSGNFVVTMYSVG